MVVMVYLVIVYDIEVERVNKVCKFLRRYLNWIQNSVFEGEVSESKLERVKTGLKEIINKNTDSILLFIFQNPKNVTKQIIGIEKSPVTNIL